MSIDIKILQSTCCGPAAPVREEIEQAAAKAGVSVTIEQPSDLQEIMKYGTMTFPSIVVNGSVYDYEEFGSANDLAELLAGAEVAGS
ncbi:MAG: thioredoxin family protein [Balneolaceae bacterium]